MTSDVLMGIIGAPHGLRGEVRVKTFTGDPMALGNYGPLHDTARRSYTVATLRLQKTVVVVRFKEVTSREQAEALNGTELFVERRALPSDLGNDEFYHSDLIGLEVRDTDGNSFGTVAAVHNFGGGDVIELKGGGSPMMPFSRVAVPKVDIKNGFITIDPVAAGLVDTDTDETP